MQLRITKPLAELQADAYKEITDRLFEFVTIDSDFPVWKQVNFSDISSERRFTASARPLVPAEQAELDYISLVRVWKTDLLLERDRVKAGIFAATTTLEIVTAKNSMMYAPIPV